MPRYYLNLWDAGIEIKDPEGHDYTDLEEAAIRATHEARSVISHDVLEGEINLDNRIDIADEAGVVRRSVRFDVAVNLKSAAMAIGSKSQAASGMAAG